MRACAATGVQGTISSRLHALSLRNYEAKLQWLMNSTTTTITDFCLGSLSLSPPLHAITDTEVFPRKRLAPEATEYIYLPIQGSHTHTPQACILIAPGCRIFFLDIER